MALNSVYFPPFSLYPTDDLILWIDVDLNCYFIGKDYAMILGFTGNMEQMRTLLGLPERIIVDELIALKNSHYIETSEEKKIVDDRIAYIETHLVMLLK